MPHKRARMCPTNEHGGREGGVAHRGKRKSGARGPRWKRTSWVPSTQLSRFVNGRELSPLWGTPATPPSGRIYIPPELRPGPGGGLQRNARRLRRVVGAAHLELHKPRPPQGR